MSIGLRVEAELHLREFALRATFTARPGLTVLFGPSGAGKSVALQAIAGLMPLHAGRITLGGRTLDDPARGIQVAPHLRRLGYVPQSYALFPHLTVAGNIAYALPRTHRLWDGSARVRTAARVAELLELVRLPGFEERWPRQLSGGQQQRVALARALAAEPEALLLDEPLSALDAPTRAAVQDDLRRVVLATGVPAIVVTHDLTEARALAERLVVLVKGRVIAEGALSEVLGAPPTAEAALLFGWRNVLSIFGTTRCPGGLRVTLSGGQTVNVPVGELSLADGWNDSAALALALRADGLALQRRLTTTAEADGTSLSGVLRSATDVGAYYSVSVVLDPGSGDAVSITCSPREWAALDAAPGDPVAIQIPAGSAKLVRV